MKSFVLIFPCEFRGHLSRPGLSVLQILLQIPIVVFIRTNHNQLQVRVDLPVGKKVLGRLYLELVNEYPRDVSLLLFADRRVLRDSLHLLIQDLFSRLPHLLSVLSERF
jgi:hypothetical protein